jgi:hypothetical protein
MVLVQVGFLQSAADDILGGPEAFDINDRVSAVLKDDFDPWLTTG